MPPCGWPCSLTWGRVCWWCSTGCDCSGSGRANRPKSGVLKMGILDRIFGGHGGGHGSSHGHGNSHGYGGSPSGHDWGRNPAPSSSGIPCPQCKAINPQGSRFCSQCAASLVPASCAKCGSVVQTGAKFCAQCGNAVI
ncbi:MAG: zinc ribbon domain-containing protein [Comamonas sp.]